MTELPIHDDNASTDRAGHPALRVGLYTGALLVIVMLGGLVAANRIPALERYALERNAISYSLFVLFTLIPVVRFWNHPIRIFASGMISWTIFVAAYDVAGMVFQNLFDSIRHTPLMALSEGAVVYGVCAVVAWVCGMLIQARHNPIVPGRKAADGAARHSQ